MRHGPVPLHSTTAAFFAAEDLKRDEEDTCIIQPFRVSRRAPRGAGIGARLCNRTGHNRVRPNPDIVAMDMLLRRGDDDSTRADLYSVADGQS